MMSTEAAWELSASEIWVRGECGADEIPRVSAK